MDGMMSKNGLYEKYPLYYVQELKRAGRRDMAMAFMDYWDDFMSEARGFGEVMPMRYYAKAWHNSYKSRGKVSIGISPQTAQNWIEEFKTIIEKFKAVSEMWENAQKEIMESSVKKSIGQQLDNNWTEEQARESETVVNKKNQLGFNYDSIGQKEKLININPSSPKFAFSEDDMRLSKLLLIRIREISPNHKQPNLDSWANSCRLMRTKDSRTVQQIENMINVVFTNTGMYAKYDGSFWQGNILSMGKLRDKYDAVSIQVKNAFKRSA